MLRYAQIEHLDGHKVTLAASGVTRPGQVVVIKGEGMPVYDSVRGTDCCSKLHLAWHCVLHAALH